MQRADTMPRVRPLWVSQAIVSGFLSSLAALLVLLAAFGVASAVGTTDPRAGIIDNWAYKLAHNTVTNLVSTVQFVQAVGLHIVAGIVWAMVYITLVEPALRGPGWRKGLIFAVIPCLFSLVVFLPIVGAGIFGMSLGAGPLPWLGSIILHAVYGLVLGELYALARGEGTLAGVNSPRARFFSVIERGMSVGLVGGALVGALVGLILALIGLGLSGQNGVILTAAGGATEGALTGVIVGIVVGLVTSEDQQQRTA